MTASPRRAPRSAATSASSMADGRTRAWAGEPRTRPTSTVCRSWWRHEDDRRLRASLRLGYALPARGPQTATHDGTGRRSTYPTPNFVRTIPATAEDGVGDGRIADDLVPAIDRDLAGDD